jgi:anti-anti-sigma factor
MATLQFSKTSEGKVSVLELDGRLDNLTAADFDKQVADLSGSRTVLDLAKLTYISSAGLRSVLSALKRSAAEGGKLVVAGPSPAVVEIFQISGFVTLIPVHPDRKAAVAALS